MGTFQALLLPLNQPGPRATPPPAAAADSSFRRLMPVPLQPESRGACHAPWGPESSGPGCHRDSLSAGLLPPPCPGSQGDRGRKQASQGQPRPNGTERSCPCIRPTGSAGQTLWSHCKVQGPAEKMGANSPHPLRLHPPFTCQSPGHRIGKIASCKQVLPGSPCHLITIITINTVITPSLSPLHFIDL